MDAVDLAGRLRNGLALPPQLREVSRRVGAFTAGTGSPVFRRLVALVWLGSSAVLAGLAWDAAGSESLIRWKRERAPAPRVWAAALDPHGFLELRDPQRLHRVLRTLPAMVDEPGGAWVSADAAWVAVHAAPEGPDAAGVPRVFGRIREAYFASPDLPAAETAIEREPAARGPKSRRRAKRARPPRPRVYRPSSPWPAAPAAEQWRNAGLGWFALEAVLTQLESSAPPAPAANPVQVEQRARNPSDPRAIDY